MRIGENTIILEEIGSTNDYAKALAAEGASHGTVVWAKRQIAGKGTHGRSFISIEGNVFYSVIIRPKDIGIAISRRLVYINALAVCGAMEKCIDKGKDSGVKLKWPNDILLEGKKVGGSLLESDASGDCVIMGTGINIVASPSADPTMIYPASSLKECGYDVNRENIIKELHARLNVEIDFFLANGFSKLRDRYLEKAFMLNEEISIGNSPDKSDYVKGIYRGIDDNGFLLLERGGKTEAFFSGTVIRPASQP